MKHCNGVLNEHSWCCHALSHRQLLGMKPLSCDNGDVKQSLMLMAQLADVPESRLVSQQPGQSPGYHSAILWFVIWPRSFSRQDCSSERLRPFFWAIFRLCSQSGGFATFGSSFSHKNVFCFCVCLVLVFVLSLFFFPSPFLHLRHFLGLMSYTFSTKSFSVNCKSFSLSDPLHPVLVLLQFQRFIFHLLPSVHFFSSNFEETWLWKVSRYCSASLKVHFISLELDFFSKMWELYKKKKKTPHNTLITNTLCSSLEEYVCVHTEVHPYVKRWTALIVCEDGDF